MWVEILKKISSKKWNYFRYIVLYLFHAKVTVCNSPSTFVFRELTVFLGLRFVTERLSFRKALESNATPFGSNFDL